MWRNAFAVIALAFFFVAAVLAFVGTRYGTRHSDLWAVFTSLGLALWLLSESKAFA